MSKLDLLANSITIGLRILIVVFFIIFMAYFIGFVSAYMKIFSYWASCKISGRKYSRDDCIKKITEKKEAKTETSNKRT